MRVVLLSAFYAPELTGIGPYSAELAEALAARGHDVYVIATFPFYPRWVARVPQGALLYRTERIGAVGVTRCRVYVPRDPRPGRRLLHELSWLAAAAGAVLRRVWWADAWLVVSPPFGSVLLGAILARLFRRRVHLHIQDLVPDVALESGQLRAGLMLRGARALARWAYRSYRSISVLSEAMGVALRRYTGGAAVRIVVAPNWVRIPQPGAAELPPAVRGRAYAVYAGSSGRKQNLALLADAAPLLARSRGPSIAILGDGPGHDSLRAGDADLRWLGLVDEATYGAVVAGAVAGIVTLAPGVGDSVVPSKLASYMSAGCPVVVAADRGSEAVRVVEEARCGVVVPPGSPEALAEALFQIAADPDERRALGARGRAYAASTWNKERLVGLIEGALRYAASPSP